MSIGMTCVLYVRRRFRLCSSQVDPSIGHPFSRSASPCSLLHHHMSWVRLVFDEYAPVCSADGSHSSTRRIPCSVGEKQSRGTKPELMSLEASVEPRVHILPRPWRSSDHVFEREFPNAVRDVAIKLPCCVPWIWTLGPQRTTNPRQSNTAQ